MSVLRDRIVNQGNDGPDMHPVGTGATPMVMPLALVQYNELGTLYRTVHPIITADGAVIPGAQPFLYPSSVPHSRGAMPA